MRAERTLLIAGKYYLLSAVALVVGGGIAAAGVYLAPGDTFAVIGPLLDGEVGAFLGAGTGAYLVVLGVLVALVGRTVATVYAIGSGLEAGLDEGLEDVERDLNRELRAMRRDIPEGEGRAASPATEEAASRPPSEGDRG